MNEIGQLCPASQVSAAKFDPEKVQKQVIIGFLEPIILFAKSNDFSVHQNLVY